MENSVVAVYDDYSDAQKAVDALVAAGFSRDTTRVSPQSEGTMDTTSTTTTAATDSDRTHESGIGHFFRSLFGSDDTDKENRDVYSESARRGSYVVVAVADNEEQADRATEIMNRFDPVDIDERSSHWKQQGWTGYDASAPMLRQDEIEAERRSYAQTRGTAGTAGTAGTDKTRIPVVEEQMAVGKREVQRGGVRVIRRVSEKPVHEQVQLREEQVNVERRPVDKPASEADLSALKDDTLEIRETAEEAVVSKKARVVEEVEVSKQVRERTEDINDTVRRTDVDVQQLGSGEATRTGVTDTGAMGTARTGVSGTGVMGTGSMDTGAMDMADDSDYRRHWQSSYANAGGRYEDYDEAYRYGSSMAGSDRYRNNQWSDYESDLRSDWESKHPGSTWEKVKDAVRYGAERVTGHRHH